MGFRIFIWIGLIGLSFSSFSQLPSNAEVRFMRTVYQQHSADLAAHTRQRLVENAFLLHQAHQRFPSLVVRQATVGFNNHYHVRRYLMSAWQAQGWLDDNAMAPLALNPAYNDDWLRRTLGNYPSDGALNQATVNKLAGIKLLDATALSNTLNMADFYQSMSMQIKYKLHQGDMSVFHSELQRWHRFRQSALLVSPLLKSHQLSLERLQDIALADILRPSLLTELGVQQTMHGSSGELERLKQDIKEQDIVAYYERHRERFRYIAKVRAYGVQFDQHEQAQKFYQQAKSQGFISAMGDKENVFGKQNSVLSRDNDSAPVFAKQLAFTLPTDTLSRPVRTPANKWLVLMSTEKAYEYYAKNSETVRYQAIEALAKEQAQQNYEAQFKAWRAHMEAAG